MDRYIDEQNKNVVGGGYITEDKNLLWEHFNDIVDLNKERCRGKGFESGVKPKELFDMINGCCVLNYFMLDNKIIAGTISSAYNGAMNLHVIAHSNEYGHFNLGNLVLLNTIEYAISNNISVFNFLWGECEYKKRFGATEQLFYDAHFYNYNFNYYIDKILYSIQCSVHIIAKKLKTLVGVFIYLIKSLLKKLRLFNIVKKLYIKLRRK